jgi:hypothetical protein
MNINIEKRLHRVKIIFNKDDIQCPYSNDCVKASSGKLCNLFYEKCSNFLKKSDS